MTGRYSRARPVRAAVILTASAITGFRALTSGTLGAPPRSDPLDAAKLAS